MALDCRGSDNGGVSGITDVTWTSWGENKAFGEGSVWSAVGGNSYPPDGGTPPTCGPTAAYFSAIFTLSNLKESADGPAFTKLSVEYKNAGPPDDSTRAHFDVPQPRT